MRAVVILLLVAVAAAEILDEPWVEEEDVDEPYNEEEEEVVYRRRRDVRDEDPHYEHVRVKRCCEEPRRVRRSDDYVRTPRHVHQYEVHEFTEEHDPSSPPYEEMLAAASDHYHKVYAEPGAPKSARYLNPDVSATVNVVSHHPANHQRAPVQNSHALPYQSVVVPPPQVGYNPQTAPQSFGVPSYQAAEGAYKPAQPAPFTKAASPHFTHPHVSSPVYVSAAPAGPAEVPAVVAAAPILTLQQLDGDQAPAAAGHHHKHAHGHKQGGGHAGHAKHHGHHGGKTSKGFNEDHYVDKGATGHKTDEHHRKEYADAAGKKKQHHDKAGHKGSHEEQAHGHRGAHFDEKKGHKKGHKTKGYHNKYHKDEFHKEHKFYDDYHKSGEHHRFGKFNAKHASNESGKKKAHHVNAGHDFVERGKKGYSNKGHVDADHKGYDGKKGHEEHHQHQSSHGKKGGKEGGSQWGYAKKN